MINKYDEYFKILNIDKTDDLHIIKRAYRKLSLLHHPDKNGDNNKFNTITDAYKILLNNVNDINNISHNKFIIDDKFDINNTNNINNNINNPNNITSISTIFDTINNINVNINLSFTQVYNGCCIPIKINRDINMNNTITNEIETIYAEIPKGTDDNEIIIIKNKGNIVNDKQSDIKLCVKLQPHYTFNRSGLDIIYNKTISLKDSLIGFTHDFTHINNKTYKIKSKNIIKDNHTETIKDLGFSRANYIGSLHIIYKIEYPDKISAQAIDSIKLLM